MKKVMLFLILACFTLGSSGFKSSDLNDNVIHLEEDGTSCFDLARGIVLATYGEINLSNFEMVLAINAACERGDIVPR